MITPVAFAIRPHGRLKIVGKVFHHLRFGDIFYREVDYKDVLHRKSNSYGLDFDCANYAVAHYGVEAFLTWVRPVKDEVDLWGETEVRPGELLRVKTITMTASPVFSVAGRKGVDEGRQYRVPVESHEHVGDHKLKSPWTDMIVKCGPTWQHQAQPL